ncbi:MAG: tetratricopeptide repeat protein [Candidatus Thorarchaeota archaeon]
MKAYTRRDKMVRDRTIYFLCEIDREFLKNEPDKGVIGHIQSIAQDLVESRLPSAESKCKSALRTKDTPALWNILAIVYLSMMDPLEARVSIERALGPAQDSVVTRNLLGEIQKELQLPHLAEMAFRQSIELDPKHPYARTQLISLLVRKGEFTEAYDNMVPLARLTKDQENFWRNMRSVLRELFDEKEVMIEYKKFSKEHAKRFFYWYTLGEMQIEVKDWIGAEKAFRRATQLDETHADSWIFTGIIFSNTQRHRAAIRAYKRAIEIEPGHADAWFNLGISYWIEKNIPEANIAINKAIAINPKIAEDMRSQMQQTQQERALS